MKPYNRSQTKSQKSSARTSSSVRSLLAGVITLLTSPITLHATVLVDLPDLNLLPNTAGQTFELFVSNDSSAVDVTGIQLNLQIADGGPEAGGSTDGPSLTAVDIFTGTIFENNNNGLTGGLAVPQVFAGGTLTSSGTVSIPNGSSKMASITFDTTGFDSGTFSYIVEDTLNGSMKYTTSGADLFPNFGSGTLTVSPVPEPSAVFGGLACFAFLGFRYLRRRLDPESQTDCQCSTTDSFMPGAQEMAIDMNDIQPAKILVVDDVLMNRELILEYFVNSKHQLMEATNGLEALSQIAQYQPDVILMDLSMPIMDGFQTARRIRMDGNLKRIPLIALTTPNDIRDGAKTCPHYDGFLNKPVKRSDLHHELRRVLRRKQDRSM